VRSSVLVLVLAFAARVAPVHAQPVLFDEALPEAGFLPRARPTEVGLEHAALDHLVVGAEETASSSLLAARDGRLVAERYFGQVPGPIEQMSITKSVASLAVGMLIGDGSIPSVDAPLSTWFPEWAAGPKARVTLRHVLTHTSGLSHEVVPETLYRHKDRLTYVRALPITEEPGTTFSYNNEACQLLAGVVRSAAGQPVSEFMERRLFSRMGITAHWLTDESGTVDTFGGLVLDPRALLRMGQLMLARGAWKGQQLVPAGWVDESTSPASESIPYCGYLWWIERTSKTDPVTGEVMWGRQIGYSARGWLGQYLAVYPRERLLAVRQRRRVDGETEAQWQHNSFRDFLSRAAALRPLVRP
jgi:CubicO group peptidase (beta-lactamase class C family)